MALEDCTMNSFTVTDGTVNYSNILWNDLTYVIIMHAHKIAPLS